MQCTHVSKSGKECQAHAVNSASDGKCWFHSRSNRAARAKARALGARRTHTPIKHLANGRPIRLKLMRDAARVIVEVIQEVRDGKIDLRRASCLGYLLNVGDAVLRAGSGNVTKVEFTVTPVGQVPEDRDLLEFERQQEIEQKKLQSRNAPVVASVKRSN